MDGSRVSNTSGAAHGNGTFGAAYQSPVTGSRYSYLWMSLAQENGWHALLDASALGAKDMETLGLSLFNPDFLICFFFKDLATGTNIVGIMNLFPASPPISNIETKLKVDNVLVQQMDDNSGIEKKTKTVSFSEIEEAFSRAAKSICGVLKSATKNAADDS
ncbi:hypothetical protein Gorai_015233, partial [Gossypium raimondii]|nr:hypothetical protein [Gossypium raimondii]